MTFGGMRAARWSREWTAGQWDNFGPDAQRGQQDRAIEHYALVDAGLEGNRMPYGLVREGKPSVLRVNEEMVPIAIRVPARGDRVDPTGRSLPRRGSPRRMSARCSPIPGRRTLPAPATDLRGVPGCPTARLPTPVP